MDASPSSQAGASTAVELWSAVEEWRDDDPSTHTHLLQLLHTPAGIAAVNLTATDDTHSCPLVLAASKGSTALVKALLAAGAHVEGSSRSSPLYWACHGGHSEVAAVLLKAGANANACSAVDGMAPLHVAALGAHADTVAVLLHEPSIDVDQRSASDDAATALWAVCQSVAGSAAARARVIELLLCHKPSPADANVACGAGNDLRGAEASAGSTPLYEACDMGCVDSVVALLRHAPTIDVNATGGLTHGETPLMVACQEAPALVPLLLGVLGMDATAEAPVASAAAGFRLTAAGGGGGGGGQGRMGNAWVHFVEAWGSDGGHDRNEVAAARHALQGESRWRRRRPLALVREQRVAVKDEAMARKVWKHCEV